MKRETRYGTVELLNVSASEELIMLAARQSYGSEDTSNKERLLYHLMKNGHGVPFEHVSVTFRLSVPIFVARQLYTYRAWSRSEKSLRYTEPGDAAWYYPEHKNAGIGNDFIEEVYVASITAYEELRKLGYSKGEARIVLPVGLHTEFIATIDLRNFQHFLEQRLDKHTQHETRMIARTMLALIQNALPLWYKVFCELHSDLVGS